MGGPDDSILLRIRLLTEHGDVGEAARLGYRSGDERG